MLRAAFPREELQLLYSQYLLCRRNFTDCEDCLASGVHLFSMCSEDQRSGSPQRGPMETLVSRVAGNLTEDCIAERRLWIAVLVTAVEDWRNGSLRKRREAQAFVFEDTADFERVCASAGVDPSGFRSRLQHIGKKVDMRNSWNRKLVA